jgi:thiamine-phosphate pyrophosphorylase
MKAGLSRPVFCLVTDRHRAEGRGSRKRSGDGDQLVHVVRYAAAAGVNLVQVRERGLDDRHLLALTREIVGAVEGTCARVVVNDRVDVALAAGAAGVHLRADSPPAAAVRAIVPAGFLIGRSVHSETEAIEAAGTGVDYLILGTIFSTPSKPARGATLGLEPLARAVRAIDLPILAIGGITADNVAKVAATGAAGFAAIGLFADLPREPVEDTSGVALPILLAGLRNVFREARTHTEPSVERL